MKRFRFDSEGEVILTDKPMNKYINEKVSSRGLNWYSNS